MIQLYSEAKIDRFIKSTPDAYNTMVGQRGLRLSGGEKQVDWPKFCKSHNISEWQLQGPF